MAFGCTAGRRDGFSTQDPRRQGHYGYDAQTGEYGELIEFGTLGTTKVTRVGLQNAASIAGLMITTEAKVAETPK